MYRYVTEKELYCVCTFKQKYKKPVVKQNKRRKKCSVRKDYHEYYACGKPKRYRFHPCC